MTDEFKTLLVLLPAASRIGQNLPVGGAKIHDGAPRKGLGDFCTRWFDFTCATGTALAKQERVRRFTNERLTEGNDMTKSRFNLLTVGALLCGLAAGSAPTARAADNAEEAPAYQPFTFGAEAGTPGFGGSANWRFSDHFGARAGLSYFSYAETGVEIEGIKYNTDLRLMSEPLGVDIYPWKKSSFRITVGILLNQNELTGTGVPDQDGFLPINGTGYDVSINGIGDLNMKVKQLPVSPYISVGASYYFDKAKHWSLSGELGVAYTGSPDVALSTSSGSESQDPELQGNLNVEAQQIESWAGKYKFFPILRIGVNYSF